MDPKNLPEEFSEQTKKDINTALDREKRISAIEKDLRTNPRYKEYFNPFHPNSVDIFINYYKLQKSGWIEFGEMYSRMEEARTLKYSEIANRLLWEIQQKKLFNLQCRWRAEEIELPEVQISYDFMLWENLITECPFIDSITEEEYELYRDYILSPDFEYGTHFYDHYQDYYEFKKKYNHDVEGNTIPEWYQFYDSRKGTGYLLTLPDIRGEKEKFYFDLYNENEIKINPDKYALNKDPDNRPFMNTYDGKFIEEFVEMFEDRKVKDYYRVMTENRKNNFHYNDDLMEALEILSWAGDVEMEIAEDWRSSILKTAKNFQVRCVYDAFETSYNNYCNRLKMEIGFDSQASKEDIEFVKSIIEIIRNKILKGRVLNGEPEDLNF